MAVPRHASTLRLKVKVRHSVIECAAGLHGSICRSIRLHAIFLELVELCAVAGGAFEGELCEQWNVVGREVVAGQCVVLGDSFSRRCFEHPGDAQRLSTVPDVVEAQLVNAADALKSAAVVAVCHRRLLALHARHTHTHTTACSNSTVLHYHQVAFSSPII